LAQVTKVYFVVVWDKLWNNNWLIIESQAQGTLSAIVKVLTDDMKHELMYSFTTLVQTTNITRWLFKAYFLNN